jgi:hypothetical protein
MISKASGYAREAGLADRPLFTRLNVARLTRRQEHDDILAQYASAKALDAEA